MTATKFLDNVSEKDIEIEPEPEPRPKSRCPDGGWGWMIVLGSFICNVIVDGICFTFGIYVTDIGNYYGSDHSKSALVGSLLVGCYLLAGPIVSALALRFGCRKVTIIGSVLTCATFVVSTHSPSIEVMLVLYGIVGGIGMGLIYLPSIVIIGYWFERRRAFATGIALCGSGIGSLIFAPLNKYLLSEYDWKQSIVIVGGLVLQCAVCGALFRPLEKAPKKMKRGIVTRGLIMKALIAEKERQRTISNGSLDNCIITKDNKLIKIDKIDLRNKSTSYLNRLKVQLGFSSGSLNRSKNSLIISPIVKNNSVILNLGDSKPVTPVQEKKDLQATPPVRSTRRKRDYERRRDSGCGSLDSPKNQSYDPIPQDDIWDLVSNDGEGCSRQPSVRSNSKPNLGGGHEAENGYLLDPTRVKPSGSFLSVNGKSTSKLSVNMNNNSKHSLLLPPGIMGNGSVMTVPPEYSASVRTLMEEYNSQQEIPSCFHNIAEMFDLSLLKNKSFDLYAFTSFLSMLGFFIPYFFLPMKVKKELSSAEGVPVEGVSDTEALVIAVIGLSNAVGRVLVGWIADRPWANTLCINNSSLILAGVVTIFCPYFTTKTMLVIFAFAFGLFTAAFLSLRSIVLVDLIGLGRLTSSFGLIILFQGLASVAGSPLAGWIMDQTGTVDSVFYMSGTLLALAGILGCPLRIRRKPSDCENDYCEYPMNSEAEMIEQVKLGMTETRM